MAARPILVCLCPRFWRMPELVSFLLWLAPMHGPVAASVVVVVRGLANILQGGKMSAPGKRFGLGAPENRSAYHTWGRFDWDPWSA
jgi:hypothetical protein